MNQYDCVKRENYELAALLKYLYYLFVVVQV